MDKASNKDKAGQTPKQAGMTLLKMPTERGIVQREDYRSNRRRLILPTPKGGGF